MNPFSALVIKDFRTYWFGSLFAMFGHRLIIVAISLLIYRLTGSAISLGIVAATAAIPIMCATHPFLVCVEKPYAFLYIYGI